MIPANSGTPVSKDDTTRLEEQLDRSFQELESLLKDSNHGGTGERLDTSRIERVAADMQAKLGEIRALTEATTQKIAAARERRQRIMRIGNGLSLLLCAGALVAAVWYFFS